MTYMISFCLLLIKLHSMIMWFHILSIINVLNVDSWQTCQVCSFIPCSIELLIQNAKSRIIVSRRWIPHCSWYSIFFWKRRKKNFFFCKKGEINDIFKLRSRRNNAKWMENYQLKTNTLIILCSFNVFKTIRRWVSSVPTPCIYFYIVKKSMNLISWNDN